MVPAAGRKNRDRLAAAPELRRAIRAGIEHPNGSPRASWPLLRPTRPTWRRISFDASRGHVGGGLDRSSPHLSTVCLHVPRHAELSRGYDASTHRRIDAWCARTGYERSGGRLVERLPRRWWSRQGKATPGERATMKRRGERARREPCDLRGGQGIDSPYLLVCWVALRVWTCSA